MIRKREKVNKTFESVWNRVICAIEFYSHIYTYADIFVIGQALIKYFEIKFISFLST